MVASRSRYMSPERKIVEEKIWESGNTEWAKSNKEINYPKSRVSKLKNLYFAKHVLRLLS